MRLWRGTGSCQVKLIEKFFKISLEVKLKKENKNTRVMFEGAVAAFLNRLLGRYVEDLDTEHFNVGIFSGETFLSDLKLKPEALVSFQF